MTQYCKNCGALIPLEACPTCPPIEYICGCGVETLVNPILVDEYEAVIKRYKERQKRVK